MSTSAQELREQADYHRQQADKAWSASSDMAQRFEGGQPIILNHHSTSSALRDRARVDRQMRRASEHYATARDLEYKAQIQEARDRQREIVKAAKTYTKDDIQKGDIIWTAAHGRKRPHRVAKVNAKSVSVETGYSWTDRIAYSEIVDVTHVEAE